ncbi:hypothetical protein CBM2609_B70066 [Cupriavidus taiwanensis]|nr:hypothetical protein CBM2604_B60065 [Cupriavidus taiwanensis]SOZ33116.1 hypothetical protein CBM2609_B70066 [Cupriavidus taiwanensis]SOZ48436.1 hypothetical protein CBM2610_B50065 [Cupriavidus taiwanensis]
MIGHHDQVGGRRTAFAGKSRLQIQTGDADARRSRQLVRCYGEGRRDELTRGLLATGLYQGCGRAESA